MAYSRIRPHQTCHPSRSRRTKGCLLGPAFQDSSVPQTSCRRCIRLGSCHVVRNLLRPVLYVLSLLLCVAHLLMLYLGYRSAFRTNRVGRGSRGLISQADSGCSSQIYRALNFSPDQQLLVTGLYGSIAPIACIASLFFIDRIGRKPILIFSSSLLSVSYLIITILSSKYDPKAIAPGTPVNDNALRAVVAMIFLVSANCKALL